MFNNLKRINQKNVLCYCTNSESSKIYSNTIALPRTKFPLKLTNKKLTENDNYVFGITGFENLYDWQRGHLSEPDFVLHDGPPYANGQPHMGHAINKILKDTIGRHQILKGNKVHFVPGWDCHGLPIELKALAGSQEKNPIQIRSKARKFAKKTMEEQEKIFRSWGVTADWKNAYKTYSADYMKLQLRQFLKLYKKNLIYRDVKPIFWSPSSRTALAEAELEYNDSHKSPSAYIKLKIRNIPKLSTLRNSSIHAIIWTTTPWTLPSNQAVCFNETLTYSVVKKCGSHDATYYIIASDLLQEISKILKFPFDVVQVVPGSALEGAVYEHPIYKNKTCDFMPSSHVSSTKGTGLVHCAGAHGPDDFLVCLKNKLQIVDLVDDAGCYTSEAGPLLEGKYVLTDGNNTVLELLKDDLLCNENITHSYPYDWRTKQPIIIKASKQWFINTEAIKNRAVEVLEFVEILPSDRSDIYKKKLISQIQNRPYWCISRQRKWGVPIPVLYNMSTSENIINENTIDHHCNLLDQVGTDFWWKLDTQELLPHNFGSSTDQIEKCEDIMDIWLDSGLSWSKVLEGTKVADMYLEGVDQFTGWFQSSLLTSVALRDKAPYKTIYVHGFAVDGNGVKMSKSVGNVVDPVIISNGNNGQNAYGINVLRWWVTCHANQHALASVSTNVLKSSAEEVQKIRNALRFAIGSLNNYRKIDIGISEMLLIDRYMLHLLYQFHNKVSEHMANFQYHKVSMAVINLLANSISALYYNSIKDRLYCDMLDGFSRKSAQFTLYHILEIVSQSVAPMLPHLVEELYLYFEQKESKTYFTSNHPKPTEEWNDNGIEKLFEIILRCKRDINVEVGANTSNSIVDITFSNHVGEQIIKPIVTLEELSKQLIDIFQVSEVRITQCDIDGEYKIEVSKSTKSVCPRCRKVNSENGQLCSRCNYVLSSLNVQTVSNVN